MRRGDLPPQCHGSRPRHAARAGAARLGWQIERVWSTDWWVDRAGTLEKLDAKLRGLLETSRAMRAEEAEKQAAADAAAAAIAKAREEAAPLDAATSTGAGIDGATQVEFELGLKSAPAEQHPQEQEAEVYARNAAGSEAAGPAVFVESDPASVVDVVSADAFFDSGYDAVLLKMIAHVVEVEGPVLDAVLSRRIARVHGWQRTGARIQERVERLARGAHQTTDEDVGTFYWASGRGPEIPMVFRRPMGEAVRAVDEICMSELVELARDVQSRGKLADSVVLTMARDLGLQRTGTAVRTRLETAIAWVAR